MVEGASRLIVLDTNALITLLTARKDCGEYNNLVAFLKQNKMLTYALPLPALAEFLAGDDNEARSLELLNPSSKFMNLEFDKKSTLISAKIYRDYRNLPKNRKAQTPHQKIKVDIQIVGIALANNAKFIITHDAGIKRVINALNLSISVFDYVENEFIQDLSKLVLAESDRVQ